MKKYLKCICFLFIALFAFSFSVSALDCKYTDGKTKAQFRLNENSLKIQFSGVSGTITTTDKSHQNGIGEEQSVQNWDSYFKKIEFTGKKYYETKSVCPPYAILVDTKGGFDFVVSDEANLQSFKDYANDKQGYAVMKLIPSSNKDSFDLFPGSCLGLDRNSCTANHTYSCVWVENDDAPSGGYCNVDNLLYVGCGGARDIPVQVPSLISLLVNLLKIATPIILIFISIITLMKALAAGKEDEIKKATSSLVKKIIAAALVFFVVAIVQFIVSIVATDEAEYNNFSDCLDCFLNNDCTTRTYYKTVVGDKDQCTTLTTGKTNDCK